jgi:hypothetical protein
MTAGKCRVVVWATGEIGSIAIRTISNRPDLDLVGVWVHSEEKAGKDAGELSNGEPAEILALLTTASSCPNEPTAARSRGRPRVVDRVVGGDRRATCLRDLVEHALSREVVDDYRGATERKVQLIQRAESAT